MVGAPNEHFQFCSARRRYNYSDFLLHAYRIGPSAYKLRRHSRWLILIPPQWISSRRERETVPVSRCLLYVMLLDIREKFMPRFPRLLRFPRWRCLVRTIGSRLLSPSGRSLEELDARDTFDLTTIRVRIILLASVMHSSRSSFNNSSRHAIFKDRSLLVNTIRLSKDPYSKAWRSIYELLQRWIT